MHMWIYFTWRAQLLHCASPLLGWSHASHEEVEQGSHTINIRAHLRLALFGLWCQKSCPLRYNRRERRSIRGVQCLLKLRLYCRKYPRWKERWLSAIVFLVDKDGCRIKRPNHNMASVEMLDCISQTQYPVQR